MVVPVPESVLYLQLTFLFSPALVAGRGSPRPLSCLS